jgi:DNA-binding transcriptional ArsR family regulator
VALATPPRDQLSATFSALADPTRRAILARLVEGEAPVKELAEPFAMSMPAVSKHLKVLERAGLIERSRHAQWRPCRLAPEPLKAVADWVEEYRGLWENRLDRLDDYLNELQARLASDRPNDAPTNTTRSASAKEQHDGRKR